MLTMFKTMKDWGNIMNRNGITHSNHYVPQFYLKNWSLDGKTVYTYRLLVSNAKVPYWQKESIKNVAAWNDFYTRRIDKQEIDDFEKWFDREFETPTKCIFTKLLKGGALDRDESIVLSRFVAAQYLRTPARLNDLLAYGRSVLPNLIQSTLMEVNNKMRSGNYNNRLQTISEEENILPMRVLLDKENSVVKVNSIVGKGLYLYYLKHLLTKTLKVLEYHQWWVLQAAEGVVFPTSDDPVICLNYRNINDYDFKGGWNRKNGNIIMPISPKLLLLTQIGCKQPYDHLDNSLYWSELFRKMIIQHAHRYVFAVKPQKGMLAINARIVNNSLYESEKNTMSGWHEEQMKAEEGL